MKAESEIYNEKLLREQKAREEAERLLQEKSLELHQANSLLQQLNEQLTSLLKEKPSEHGHLEYKTLIDSLNDIVFRTTLEGTITFTNPITTQITGYQPNEILGKNIFDFIDPAQKPHARRIYMKQFIEQRCLSYNEFKINTKYGTSLWMGLNVQFFEEKCLTCTHKPWPIFQNPFMPKTAILKK